MPSISDLLSRATKNRSDVTQFMKLPLDLEGILRILNLNKSNTYSLASDALHLTCGVIYLYHTERLSQETTERLKQISSELEELATDKISEYEYNRRAMYFLFTATEIDPVMRQLNLSFESAQPLRRIANEISRLQFQNRVFFIKLLEALQIKTVCNDLLTTRARATVQRNYLNPPLKPSPPPKPSLPPKRSSSTEFVNIPTPTDHPDAWDEMDDVVRERECHPT